MIQKQTQKIKTKLGEDHPVWGAFDWIRFHIYLLRGILEEIVKKNYVIDQEIINMLPISPGNKSVYKNFWFPIRKQIHRTNSFGEIYHLLLILYIKSFNI